MTEPRKSPFRERFANDRALTRSVRRLLRARGIAGPDVDDTAQITFFEAYRAERLPETDKDGRRYLHGIARRVAVDWRVRQKTNPLDIALHARAVNDDGSPGLEGSLAGAVVASDFAPSSARTAEPEAYVEPAYETVDLAHKVVEEALKEFPRPFSMFWRTEVVGETAAEVARTEGISAGRVRGVVSETRGSLRKIVERVSAIVGVVLSALFMLVGVLGRRGSSLPPPPEEARPAASVSSAASARETARSLREAGLAACEAHRWTACLAAFDAARRDAPDLAEEPAVREARKEAERALAHPEVDPRMPPDEERK